MSSTPDRRRPLHARPVLWIAAYVGAWVVAAFSPIPLNDIDAFFLPSAQQFLAGHPLMAYQPLGQSDYPNANGPLALLPLAAATAVLQALGWLAVLPCGAPSSWRCSAWRC